MPGAFGRGPVAVGGTARFFPVLAKSVISLLHSHACKSTDHMEGRLPRASLFFCVIPSFRRVFWWGSFEEDLERVTFSPAALLFGTSWPGSPPPSRWLEPRPWGSAGPAQRGRSLPCALLGVHFPVSVHKSLLPLTQMKSSPVQSWALPYGGEHIRVNTYLKDTEILEM